MALTRTQLVDLVMEEKQIEVKLDKMQAVRNSRKAVAQQACADAMNQIDADYVTATQAAESRLVEIRAILKAQAAWGE